MRIKARAKSILIIPVLAFVGMSTPVLARADDSPVEVDSQSWVYDVVPFVDGDFDDDVLPPPHEPPPEYGQSGSQPVMGPSGSSESGLASPSVVGADSLESFQVSGDMSGTYDTFTDALDAVNADSGSVYTVSVLDDPSASETSAATLNSGKTVTLTSASGGPYTLLASAGFRHVVVYGDLILSNIKLDGGGVAGGVHVSGGTLTLNEGGIIQDCKNLSGGSGGAVEARAGASVKVAGGEVRDSVARTTYFGIGGGIYTENSTLEMTGGVISGNDAFHGGGVYLAKGSTFDLWGGEISGNTLTTPGESEGGGGGVYVYSSSTFTMHDGLIKDNTAELNGGGIYAAYASQEEGGPTSSAMITIHGGRIEGNKSKYGGGVAAEYLGQITMDGGAIVKNTASTAGGGVAVRGSYLADDSVKFEMSKGEITGNYAESYGGGIWLRGYYGHKNTVTLGTEGSTEGPLISENTSNGHGGGIVVHSPDAQRLPRLVMHSGTISNNSTRLGGGGIAVIGGGDATITGGVIGGDDSGNKAQYGGGIATIALPNNSSNVLTTTDTIIKGNIAETDPEDGSAPIGDGGGIYLTSPDQATLKTTNITGNRSAENGGGIYINTDAQLNAADTTSINNNTAGINGGGIYTTDFEDYANLTANDYQNLDTAINTIFSGNQASHAYTPPQIAATYTNIGFTTTSLGTPGAYLNPINNLDINFDPPPLLEVSKGWWDPVGQTIRNSVIVNRSSWSETVTVKAENTGSAAITGLKFSDSTLTPSGSGDVVWDSCAVDGVSGKSKSFPASPTFPVALGFDLGAGETMTCTGQLDMSIATTSSTLSHVDEVTISGDRGVSDSAEFDLALSPDQAGLSAEKGRRVGNGIESEVFLSYGEETTVTVKVTNSSGVALYQPTVTDTHVSGPQLGALQCTWPKDGGAGEQYLPAGATVYCTGELTMDGMFHEDTVIVTGLNKENGDIIKDNATFIAHAQNPSLPRTGELGIWSWFAIGALTFSVGLVAALRLGRTDKRGIHV